MGGDLGVESEPGKGTRFFFTIPLPVYTGQKNKKAADKKVEIQDSETATPLNILLVDDSEDNRLLVRSFLKKYPYTIEAAENGLIAFELFRKGKYNLVLMDMQMPVMDGYTAMRQIRAEPRERSASPHTSTTLKAMGIIMASLTVIDGVRAERMMPMMSQLMVIVR